jgi:hypothetical protein
MKSVLITIAFLPALAYGQLASELDVTRKDTTCVTSVKEARAYIRAEMRKKNYNFGWGAISFSAGLIGGVGWGVHETSVHKPWNFPSSYNPLWWDASQSWPNKYKNRDQYQGPRYFGSTTFFVQPTDAKHSFSSKHKVGLFSGGFMVGVSVGKGKPWWHYLADAVFFGLGYSIGFHSTYTYNMFPR